MLPSCAARKAPGPAGAACTAAAAPAPAGAARAARALPAMSEALGRRVLCGAERATVRYVGGLPGAAGRWAATGSARRAGGGGCWGRWPGSCGLLSLATEPLKARSLCPRSLFPGVLRTKWQLGMVVGRDGSFLASLVTAVVMR